MSVNRGSGGSRSPTTSATTDCANRPGPKPPCSLRFALVKCHHCGTKDRSYKGLLWAINAKGVGVPLPTSVPPREAASKSNAHLHITADSPKYAEVVHLGVGVAAACGQHPLLGVGRVTNGKAVLIGDWVKKTEINPTIVYDTAWFTSVLESIQTRGPSALAHIFFPPAWVYRFEAQTCGARPTLFGNPRFLVFVYPSDKFKLSIELEPFIQHEDKVEVGTRDAQAFQRQQREQKRGGQTVSSTETSARGSAGGVIRQTRTTAAVGPGRVVTSRGSVSVTKLLPSPEEKNPGFFRKAASAIKLERNGTDVTKSLGVVAKIIDAVKKIHGIISTAIASFKKLADAKPEVGWSFKVDLTLFKGQASLEWGWEEVDSQRFAKKSLVLEGELTLIQATFEVSFGVSVLGAVAKVYAKISGALILSGTAKRKESQIDLISRTTGTAGVVAGWEGTFAVSGNVSTGIDLQSSLKFGDAFSWTVEAKLRAGKGSGTITVLGFETTKEWTFWEARPIGQPFAII